MNRINFWHLLFRILLLKTNLIFPEGFLPEKQSITEKKYQAYRIGLIR